MCPGRSAMICCACRSVSQFGSMNFRRFKPSCARSRVMVRRLDWGSLLVELEGDAGC
jgi:hypothetical protein